jgi:hypothetical protein
MDISDTNNKIGNFISHLMGILIASVIGTFILMGSRKLFIQWRDKKGYSTWKAVFVLLVHLWLIGMSIPIIGFFVVLVLKVLFF